MYIAGGALTGWVTAAAGDGVVWTGNAWNNVGPIRGPAGAAGPAGAKGDTGAAGPQGNIGPQGPAGPSSWGAIPDKPTTVAGYAITDVYSIGQMNASLALKANVGGDNATGNWPISITGNAQTANVTDRVKNHHQGQPSIKLWSGTQADYDAVTPKDPEVWYAIIG
jgi:hypothetical protein